MRVLDGAIPLKNSQLISAVFGSDDPDRLISIGCSLPLSVLSGVLYRERRFGGVFGEFSKVLSCCGEEKFVIGPSGASQP